MSDADLSLPQDAPPESRAFTPPAAAEAGFLRNLWYFALPGRDLSRGQMAARTLLGEPLLFGRAADGAVFAMHDIYPHRGIPLSYGSFDGREVECCYHGWRFGPDGRCTKIPSLVEGQSDAAVNRIRVRSYPCREVQGAIWVYMSDKARAALDEAALPPPPMLPDIAEGDLQIADELIFPCHVDHAVIGLMDPAHGPFVHKSWWWRPGASAHEKAKRFGPSELGFTMLRHKPSKNSRAYGLLGGAPETEISFRLPGLRIEHIRAGRHRLVNLTAVTPVSESETRVCHLIYWTLPWLTMLKPALRKFARAFLEQDRKIVVMQQEGLKHRPNLMLIDDADRQAKWYYRLKKEWQASQAEARPFANPVSERVLRWKS
jgi:phenylpropionate dioxygenase-like ring-hydroxylating dioxygenase large terminal subunit